MLDQPSELVRKQILFAREYTNQLLADVRGEDWFRCPEGAPSHLAWQVGHLAVAEYGLTMLRIRGKLSEDAQMISNDYLRAFKKGTEPQSDPRVYPDLDVIRGVFDRVHTAALEIIPSYDSQLLEETLPMPYAVYPTKLGSLLFCPAHEMVHAGQIGLLRRLLGYPPLR